MTGWAAFLLTALLVELTPGPNMAWLAVVAAGEGAGVGLAAVAGVALGLGVVGVAAALGLAALVAASPALYEVLRWGGAAYLLWLAWDGWRGAVEEAPPLPGRAVARAFRRGLVTNLLNPKAGVFYVAVLPGFLPPGDGLLPQTLALTGGYVAVATGVHAGIVGLAGQARRLLTDPTRERRVRRGLSLALAGVAVWLLWRS
ncbi:LysE family translocator [Rubellimicrobium aerolatum]|uniref:LysE family translocator n=1 Tax=Rubellimicrobium aerolatum TaxID=490979 RepID=A0ABW0SEZ1_9RHOB|nr:LysE family translocator [Rubellimicrobium aerolatum]MBP1806503.1 threonine/homoserine/homoserine lactone efflux protein [Rubellimicrobium aerolatum]